jgi:hypothetical protein
VMPLAEVIATVFLYDLESCFFHKDIASWYGFPMMTCTG